MQVFAQEYLWLIAPAYATVLLLFFGVLAVKAASRRMKGLRLLLRPIDLGKTWFDGRRIIGDHKPIVGWFLPLVASAVSYPFTQSYGLTLLLCYAAFFGDLAGSFLKRRLAIAEHASFLIVDQLNFLIGAYAVALALGLWVPLWDLLILAGVTFALHFGSNMLFYWVGLKRELPY